MGTTRVLNKFCNLNITIHLCYKSVVSLVVLGEKKLKMLKSWAKLKKKMEMIAFFKNNILQFDMINTYKLDDFTCRLIVNT